MQRFRCQAHYDYPIVGAEAGFRLRQEAYEYETRIYLMLHLDTYRWSKGRLGECPRVEVSFESSMGTR